MNYLSFLEGSKNTQVFKGTTRQQCGYTEGPAAGEVTADIVMARNLLLIQRRLVWIVLRSKPCFTVIKTQGAFYAP